MIIAEAQSRLSHEGELDDAVSRWTSTQGQYQVMETLQSAGVPAGPVLDARGLLADPHFAARGFFEGVDHPSQTGLGHRAYIGRGWKLSKNKVAIRRPAPLLGEQNEYVLEELLALPQHELASMVQEGLVGQEPVGGGAPSSVSLERQVELGWTVESDPDYPSR